MLAQRILYYGKDEPLPERIPLRAGPLTLFWEDGDLRTVKLGEREVLRRIYVATRDRNWGTVPNQLENLRVRVEDASFAITFDVVNRQNEIDFTWQGQITGDRTGRIVYTMDGVAHTTFMKARIGFCVLHPAEAAGSTCRVEHVDGSVETAELPVYLRPEQPMTPFAEMAAMAHEVTPGVWFSVRFSGDIFETEDQRNWTDASYKTFSTPLRIPYPAEVQAGTRIVQTLELRVKREQAVVVETSQETLGVTFAPIEDAAPAPLPWIGLGVASHGQPLETGEIELLRALHLHHLRVDLWPERADWRDQLARAAQQAQALGVGLEIALFLGEQCRAELDQLRVLLQKVQPPVATWLVIPAREKFRGGSPVREVVEAARPVLAAYAPHAPLISGTNTDFIFVLRSPPPPAIVDGLVYAISPQAHAFDNLSLVETLACQAVTVASARQLSAGKPVYVSPVTLKMRHNPYATAAPPPTPPGELPPQVDVRQMSLFGAGWTLGSIKHLAESGAASVTYFETTGWRGVMETAAGSAVAKKFHSLPGSVFPLYHVLAAVGEYAGGDVLPSKSSDPLVVDGLILRKATSTMILLANYTDAVQTVTVAGISGPAVIRVLDEANVETAMTAVESFRGLHGEHQPIQGGAMQVTLRPYAVVRIDVRNGD